MKNIIRTAIFILFSGTLPGFVREMKALPFMLSDMLSMEGNSEDNLIQVYQNPTTGHIITDSNIHEMVNFWITDDEGMLVNKVVGALPFVQDLSQLKQVGH